MQFAIRQENKQDYSAVFELNNLAFGQPNEAKLVDALRNNPEVFIPELSLVATLNNEIVGHILFTKIKIIDDKKIHFNSLALAPMAVKPDFQKRGIGSKLISTGLERARELEYQSVIVLGHKFYYPKFGFFPANKWNIKSPFAVPTDAFMGIELVEYGFEKVSGTVKYPIEFDVVCY